MLSSLPDKDTVWGVFQEPVLVSKIFSPPEVYFGPMVSVPEVNVTELLSRLISVLSLSLSEMTRSDQGL